MAANAILKASLRMDSRQYKAGMKGAEASTKRFQSGIASMGRTLGAAFSVTAVIGLTAKLVTLGSTITDLAIQAGISTDTFQGLETAALKAGIAPELITKSFIKLNVVMGQAKSGMKTYLDLFDKVGISAKELHNMGPEQVFERIAQTMATSNRGAVEYGAALELLGKSGGKMIEVMKRINEVGLKGVTQDARDLGTLIENETLVRLDLLADRFGIGKKQAFTYGAAIGGVVFELHDMVKEMTLAEKAVALLSGGLFALPAKLGTLFGEFEGTRAEKSDRDPMAGRAAQALADSIAIKKAQEANAAMARARLKGREKLAADLDFAHREIDKKIKATSNKDLKRELDNQKKLLTNYYHDDLAALEDSERKKREASEKTARALKKRSAEREQGLRESSEERVASLVGRGTTVSELARVGGFVGPQRGGLASADRQLQTLREHTRLLQAIEAGQAREAEAAERAASVASGDLGN